METESDQWGSCHEHRICQVVPSPGSCSLYVPQTPCLWNRGYHCPASWDTVNTQYSLHHDRHSKAQTSTLLFLSIRSLSRMNDIKKLGRKQNLRSENLHGRCDSNKYISAEWLSEQQKLCIPIKEMESWCLRHHWDRFSGQMGSCPEDTVIMIAPNNTGTLGFIVVQGRNKDSLSGRL